MLSLLQKRCLMPSFHPFCFHPSLGKMDENRMVVGTYMTSQVISSHSSAVPKGQMGHWGGRPKSQGHLQLYLVELFLPITLVSFTNFECFSSHENEERSSQSYVAMSQTSSCNSPKVLYFSLSSSFDFLSLFFVLQ